LKISPIAQYFDFPLSPVCSPSQKISACALLFTITERESLAHRLLHNMGKEMAELAHKGSKREKKRL
jgi:hypothetical protein